MMSPSLNEKGLDTPVYFNIISVPSVVPYSYLEIRSALISYVLVSFLTSPSPTVPEFDLNILDAKSTIVFPFGSLIFGFESIE